MDYSSLKTKVNSDTVLNLSILVCKPKMVVIIAALFHGVQMCLILLTQGKLAIKQEGL